MVKLGNLFSTFFPTRMAKAHIIASKSSMSVLLQELQESGLMQIIDYGDQMGGVDKDSFSSVSLPPEYSRVIEYELKVSRLMETFGPVLPEERSMVQIMTEPLEPKMFEVSRTKLEELFDTVDERVDKVQPDVDHLRGLLQQVSEKLEVLGEDIRNLEKLEGWLTVAVSDLQFKYTKTLIASTHDSARVESALRDLKETYYDIHTKEDGSAIFVILSTPDDWETVGTMAREKLLAELEFSEDVYGNGTASAGDGFLAADAGGTGTVSGAIDYLKSTVKSLEEKKTDMLGELRKLYDQHYDALLIFRDSLRIEHDKYMRYKSLGESSHTFIINGYTPVHSQDKLEALVEDKVGGLCVFEPVAHNDENAPVELHNPDWVKPYEMLTRMFSLPKYNEIDPTIIIGPLFVLFFGLMLGDAIYGLMLVASGLVMLRGAGKFDEEYRHYGIILTSVGASTIFFGIIQGGYLGDAVVFFFGEAGEPGVFGDMHGITDAIYSPVFLNGIENPILLLQIALIIGLFQINLGLLIAAYQEYHQRDINGIFLKQVPFFLLEIGASALLGSFFGWYSVPGWFMATGSVLALAGLALIFVEHSLLGFFEITGFLGNWLSYARLLALGLATAGIAATFNILTGLVGSMTLEIDQSTGAVLLILGVIMYGLVEAKLRGFVDITIPSEGLVAKLGLFLLVIGVLGVIHFVSLVFILLGVVVFIGGHLFNAVMQALGAFVHSLRLQYVEFFGTFYAGGGDEYKPFKSERIYTKLPGGDE